MVDCTKEVTPYIPETWFYDRSEELTYSCLRNMLGFTEKSKELSHLLALYVVGNAEEINS